MWARLDITLRARYDILGMFIRRTMCFAMGVVGYLLLTNQYLWDVTANEDIGHLEKKMRTTTPIPVAEINSLVSRATAAFFARLLDVRDAERPSAAAARDEVRGIIKMLQGEVRASPV